MELKKVYKHRTFENLFCLPCARRDPFCSDWDFIAYVYNGFRRDYKFENIQSSDWVKMKPGEGRKISPVNLPSFKVEEVMEKVPNIEAMTWYENKETKKIIHVLEIGYWDGEFVFFVYDYPKMGKSRRITEKDINVEEWQMMPFAKQQELYPLLPKRKNNDFDLRLVNEKANEAVEKVMEEMSGGFTPQRTYNTSTPDGRYKYTPAPNEVFEEEILGFLPDPDDPLYDDEGNDG